MKNSIICSILFILGLLTINRAFSQITFKNERGFKVYGQSFLDTANILYPFFDSVNFELRVWHVSYSNKVQRLFIVSQEKITEQWKLREYSFISWNWQSFESITQSTSILKSWGNDWDSLVAYGILTLLDEAKVKRKWRSSKDIELVITDGSKYVFELITRRNRRSYAYANPEINFQHYDINNKELVAINKIITLLKSSIEDKE